MVDRRRFPLILLLVSGLLLAPLYTIAQGSEEVAPPLDATNSSPQESSPDEKSGRDRLTPEQRQKMREWLMQHMGTNSLSPEAIKQLTPEQREQLHEKMKEIKGGLKSFGVDFPRKNGPPRSDRKPIPLLDERFPKMIEIAAAPEEKVNALATQIAASQNLPPEMGERILSQMKEFRKRLRDDALQAAKSMNVTLTPEKEGDFIRDYWTKRMEVEKTLHQEVEPRRKQLMDQAREELCQQYGGTLPPTPSNTPPEKK